MTQRTSSREVRPDSPVRDIMHRNPVVVEASTRVLDAARTMQNRDLGSVLVQTDNGGLGILTDRDLVVRVVANEKDPAATTVGEVCTAPLASLSPDDTVARAVELMNERAVRRLPVVDQGAPVGIVSLGDLAIEREPGSTLGGISAASPNL